MDSFDSTKKGLFELLKDVEKGKIQKHHSLVLLISLSVGMHRVSISKELSTKEILQKSNCLKY